MLLKLIATVILACIAGMGYRMGGSGNYPRWLREAIDCTCMILVCLIWGLGNWSLVLCYGLMWGAMTTYFKKKGTEAQWYHWAIVGFATSFCMLPLVLIKYYGLPYSSWPESLWLAFIIRILFQTVAICVWRTWMGNAVIQELGTGFIMIITLPLLALFRKKTNNTGGIK